jgi:hypothetical protein
LSQQLIEVTETRQKRCPPQGEKVLFVYFLSPLGQKVRRPVGRKPPVLPSENAQGQQIKYLLPSLS